MAAPKKQKNIVRRQGFTLIEAMFAIMIIGIGIAALMTVFAAGTNINAYGDRLSKAVFLADELRSMTDNKLYANLLAYDGRAFNGVDANETAVAGLQDYQQVLWVRGINPSNMTPYSGTSPPGLMITARVLYENQEVTRLCWIRTP